MSDVVTKVREISHDILSKSDAVKINMPGVEKVAHNLANALLSEWHEQQPSGDEVRSEVCRELVASAINYCYWFGGSGIRPCGASSARMYELLHENWTEDSYFDLEAFLDKFYSAMALNRFPLLEYRYAHLRELISTYRPLCESIAKHADGSTPIPTIERIVTAVPGFASDLFLKRVQLFIIQLNRKIGLFSTEQLTIPADYQVPKVLHELECIVYSPDLENKVMSEMLIASGSKEEVSIRAATVIACDKIAQAAGVNCMVVDNFLWQSRQLCTKPFHLTITTDY
jgi:hypothetical protein